jgi:hypothetical protein
MGMVFRSSEIYRSSQSSRIFSRAQCAGKNMASYTYQRHTQPILCDSAGATLDFNFNVSKHSKESVAGTRLSASLSINIYVALFMHGYISPGPSVSRSFPCSKYYNTCYTSSQRCPPPICPPSRCSFRRATGNSRWQATTPFISGRVEMSVLAGEGQKIFMSARGNHMR